MDAARKVVAVPYPKELVAAYQNLDWSHSTPQQLPSSEQLLRYLELSRFDARFFEVFSSFLARHFNQINPVTLNLCLREHPWAPAMGAVLEHARLLVGENRPLFDGWKDLVMHAIDQAPGELYFMGIFDFKPHILEKIRKLPCQLFLKWGYYHHEIVANKAERLNRTVLPLAFRRQLLAQLKRRKHPVSVAEYRALLNGLVSIRQAQRDLRSIYGRRHE